jgi:hypothetical protein
MKTEQLLRNILLQVTLYILMRMCMVSWYNKKEENRGFAGSQKTTGKKELDSTITIAPLLPYRLIPIVKNELKFLKA